MALASLLATGRVRFLSQCKHVGGGVVVSLLEENITYKVCLLVLLYFCCCYFLPNCFQVSYRKKLVDATCCETIVPATSAPGFKVAPGVNFIPINGR